VAGGPIVGLNVVQNREGNLIIPQPVLPLWMYALTSVGGLIPWSKVLLEKLIIAVSCSKNSPPLWNPKY
jgi:hypothetical protein